MSSCAAAWPDAGGPRPPAGHVVPAWPVDRPPMWMVWQTLFRLQGGICAMCVMRTADWVEPVDDRYRLAPSVIDHDHLTGLIRGLLCRRCNRHEGICNFRDDCYCATYRRVPPAQPFHWTYRSL